MEILDDEEVGEIGISFDDDGLGLMELVLVRPITVDSNDQKAMVQADDLATLNNLDHAVEYCNSVLFGLHPELKGSDLHVSVGKVELPEVEDDEGEGKVFTELR